MKRPASARASAYLLLSTLIICLHLRPLTCSPVPSGGPAAAVYRTARVPTPYDHLDRAVLIDKPAASKGSDQNLEDALARLKILNTICDFGEPVVPVHAAASAVPAHRPADAQKKNTMKSFIYMMNVSPLSDPARPPDDIGGSRSVVEKENTPPPVEPIRSVPPPEKPEVNSLVLLSHQSHVLPSLPETPAEPRAEEIRPDLPLPPSDYKYVNLAEPVDPETPVAYPAPPVPWRLEPNDCGCKELADAPTDGEPYSDDAVSPRSRSFSRHSHRAKFAGGYAVRAKREVPDLPSSLLFLKYFPFTPRDGSGNQTSFLDGLTGRSYYQPVHRTRWPYGDGEIFVK